MERREVSTATFFTSLYKRDLSIRCRIIVFILNLGLGTEQDPTELHILTQRMTFITLETSGPNFRPEE